MFSINTRVEEEEAGAGVGDVGWLVGWLVGGCVVGGCGGGEEGRSWLGLEVGGKEPRKIREHTMLKAKRQVQKK